MKLGSLFDGSGTAPLAATMCGIEPVWASEIEPYPIKVTKARFPNMKHLGSILDIDGAVVEPVDIICGGSPCQDLSVAGKQKGLHEGERSHLFFEMTRIIKQMREATNGKYPRYVIWENVPGAFSSNKGADFLAVLQAFAEIADPNVHVPEPEKRGGDKLAWRYSGEMVGDGWSIAWRTVDAQYWGVPQRRRRIYLVTDLGSERAGEILFERESVSGNHEPSKTQRKETAADAGRSVEGSSEQRICSGIREAEESICRRDEEQNRSRNERTSRVDFREANGSGDTGETIGGVKCLNPWDSQSIRQYDSNGIYPALSANENGGLNRQGVCYPLNEQVILRHNKLGKGTGFGAGEDGDPAYTLQANHPHMIAAGFVGRQGAKSNSVGFEEGISPTLRQGITTDVVFDITGVNSNSIKSPTPDSCFKQRDIGRTLDTFVGSPECNQGGMVVVSSVDCRNIKLNEELSCTLQAKSAGGYSLNYQNPVMYEAHGFGRYRDGCGTLRASDGDCGPGSEMLAVYPGVGITSKQNQSNPKLGDPCHTLSTDSRNYLVKECYPDMTGSLCAKSHPGSYTRHDAFNNMLPVVPSDKPPRKYIVRRLTPLECCRLQGFPDWWEDGVEGSDSARYKMWGNGMALPNMLHVMKGIARMEAEEKCT